MRAVLLVTTLVLGIAGGAWIAWRLERLERTVCERSAQDRNSGSFIVPPGVTSILVTGQGRVGKGGGGEAIPVGRDWHGRDEAK